MKILSLLLLCLASCHTYAYGNRDGKIAANCAFTAQQIYDIAYEKLDPNSEYKDLDSYLRANMTTTEYQVMAKHLLMLEKYVNANLKGHTALSLARTSFYECIENTYKRNHINPTEKLMLYIQRFEAVMDKIKKAQGYQGM